MSQQLESGSRAGLTAGTANQIYKEVGDKVNLPDTLFRLSGAHFGPSSIVDQVIREASLDFTPDKFQQDTWHALASRHSVILTAPCSSGKFLTADLGVDVMRNVTGISDGLGIGLMPLTCIMAEVGKGRSDVAYITMEGDIKSNTGEQTVKLSDTIESIVRSGQYKHILGHIESFSTPEGAKLLDALEEASKLVFLFVDEVQ